MAATSRRDFLAALGVTAAVGGARPLFARPAENEQQAGARPAAAAPPRDLLLNYNESPYGPSPRALAAIRAAKDALVSRYHVEETYDSLRDALAAHHGVTRDHIRIGAGSTEILKACDDVFLADGKTLVVANPAYEAVIQYAANSKAEATRLSLTDDYAHDLPRMARTTNLSTGLIYVCNPNNPSGTINRKDEVAFFMARVPESATVLFDEAYAEFVSDPGYESAVKYVKEGRNVIVAKTFSKIHGMAGMRIGYAIAKPELIARIAPFTVDYAVTGLAANAALASVKDVAYTREVARKNAIERTRFVAEMKKLGLSCAEPHGNFVMVDLGRPVSPVIGALAAKRILVGREFGAMPNFLRVTLGTAAEMTTFYPVFRAAMTA